MSTTTDVAPTMPLPVQPRVAPTTGVVAWAKTNLFATWASTAVTLGLGYVIVRIVIAFVEWAVIGAVWTVPYSSTGIAQTAVCQNAKGTGACWAVIADKYRLILFGAIRTTSNGGRPWSC
jgi:general L-amino acid transport system permease protein